MADQQLQHVKALHDFREQLDQLASKLDQLIKDNEQLLKDKCAAQGHNWHVEVDDDAHSSSLISVCDRCQTWVYGVEKPASPPRV